MRNIFMIGDSRMTKVFHFKDFKTKRKNFELAIQSINNDLTNEDMHVRYTDKVIVRYYGNLFEMETKEIAEQYMNEGGWPYVDYCYHSDDVRNESFWTFNFYFTSKKEIQ